MESKWLRYTEDEKAELNSLCRAYCEYLDNGKTERECVSYAVKLAEKAGFKPLNGQPLKPGDRVYATSMGKTIALFVIGKEPVINGLNVLGAHIDSPRLDVKACPLYEEADLAYFDLHYYGGIKKYQWVAIPLAIHGVVILKSGEKINVVIGEDDSDPVLCITDLLPHLAQEQVQKIGEKVIEGENLDLLVGSIPAENTEKDAVKEQIKCILKTKYGFDEEDFLSAELEVVPAGKARAAGLDESMILAYGHDDRVCAYTSLEAIMRQTEIQRTACCLLVDKEEIGSEGGASAQSNFFFDAVADVLAATGYESDTALRKCLRNSLMLSSDVSSAFDPLYSSVFDRRNAAYIGKGASFNKFTGRGGKSGGNDANPEFIAQLRRILDHHDVNYQLVELGRVDAGGGGTIACVFARYGMQVIDCGVPVMSMHAPAEIVSKSDVYEVWKVYMKFLAEAVSEF